MGLKGLTRVGSLMIIFFFLPSIGLKIWEYLVYSPWPAKSWLVYLTLGIVLIYLARIRMRKRALLNRKKTGEPSLLQIATERLVKGEISVAEYRAIKREITGDK